MHHPKNRAGRWAIVVATAVAAFLASPAGATDSAFRIDYPFQGAAGVEGDPLLADPFDDFRLTAASVLAIDSGAAMPGTVDDDFDRLPRPIDGDEGGTAEWDIGPHEYSPGIFADGFETGNTSAWSLP